MPNGKMLKDGQVSPDGYVVNTGRSVFLHAPTDTDPARLVPPQTMPHIGDRLDAKGVSWKWYAGGYDDALAGMPDPKFPVPSSAAGVFPEPGSGNAGAAGASQGPEGSATPTSSAARLPQVSFYKPIGQLNLHPGYANITDGDAHLGELVERLQRSPLYADMLIIVTYDENGGYWDHVPPPRPRPLGTRDAHPADRHRPHRQARLRRSHDLRFRLDPQDDRGAVRPRAAE